MKIVAQSQVPSGMPYLHLGYLATTSVKPEGSLVSVGLVLALAGVAMATAACFARKQQEPALPRPRRDTRRRFALAGLVVLMLGISGTVLAYRHGQVVYDHPEMLTHYRLDLLSQEVAYLQQQGVGMPPPLEVLRRDHSEPGYDRTVDGWFRPFRLQEREYKGKKYWVAWSAGPDGIFGTADDITANDKALEDLRDFAETLAKPKQQTQ